MFTSFVFLNKIALIELVYIMALAYARRTVSESSQNLARTSIRQSLLRRLDFIIGWSL